jgi:hypothetical protein
LEYKLAPGFAAVVLYELVFDAKPGAEGVNKAMLLTAEAIN